MSKLTISISSYCFQYVGNGSSESYISKFSWNFIKIFTEFGNTYKCFPKYSYHKFPRSFSSSSDMPNTQPPSPHLPVWPSITGPGLYGRRCQTCLKVVSAAYNAVCGDSKWRLFRSALPVGNRKKTLFVYWDTPWKWNFSKCSCAWECKSIYEPLCEYFFEISLNVFKNCPQLIFL